VNKNLSDWEQFSKRKEYTQLQISNFIMQWVKYYGYDFVGEKNAFKKDLLKEFVRDKIGFGYPLLAKQILKHFDTTKYEFSHPIEYLEEQSVFSFGPIAIAEQLTYRDSIQFCQITVKKFY
jgi:hypothetical protein